MERPAILVGLSGSDDTVYVIHDFSYGKASQPVRDEHRGFENGRSRLGEMLENQLDLTQGVEKPVRERRPIDAEIDMDESEFVFKREFRPRDSCEWCGIAGDAAPQLDARLGCGSSICGARGRRQSAISQPATAQEL